jgi:hypothetical protein
MPRTVSLPALQAMLAQQTSAVFLELLTVDHADLSSPIRLVNNTVDITSNANVFTAAAFRSSLPTDTEKRAPSARITVSNIDQTIIIALRSVSSPPTFTLAVISADTPDTYEYGPIDLELRDYQTTAQAITMTIALEDFAQEGWPSLRFDPVNFPGLF